MKRKRSEIVPREALASMSTAMLHELLNRELAVDGPADVDVVLIQEITAILNARTGESKIDVDAKYDELVAEYLGCEMLYPADERNLGKEEDLRPLCRRKRLARAALIAALFVVLFVVSAQAAGVDLLEALAQWTEETFSFLVAGEEADRATTQTDLFSELKYELALDNLTDVPLPWYLPEGYVFRKLASGNGEYCAIYEKEDNVLKIQIHQTQSGNASRMEKNDVDPEKYVVNGVEHCIVSNLDRYSVTWVSGGYECTISGIPSMEEAHQMIDSIYWED